MTDEPSRANAVTLVNEARKEGGKVEEAYKLVGICSRTYERWSNDFKREGASKDKRPKAVHPEPKNKLTQEERQQILEICNSKEFADSPPCQIVPALADRGCYIALRADVLPCFE